MSEANLERNADSCKRSLEFMTNVLNIPRLLSLYVLLLFVAVSSIWTLDPSQRVSSYIRNRFTDEDGLPSSNIVDQMVQSRDGFLLLRSGGSLAHFDGRISTCSN